MITVMSSPASFPDTPTASEAAESVHDEGANFSMTVQNDGVPLSDRPMTPSSADPSAGSESLRRATRLQVHQTPVHFQPPAALQAPALRAAHRHLSGTRPPQVTPTSTPRISTSYAYSCGSSEPLLSYSPPETHLTSGSSSERSQPTHSLSSSIYSADSASGLGDNIGTSFGGGRLLPQNHPCPGSGSFVSSGTPQTQNQTQTIHSSFQKILQPRLDNSAALQRNSGIEFPVSQQPAQHQLYYQHHDIPVSQPHPFQQKPTLLSAGLSSSSMAPSLGVPWQLTASSSSRTSPLSSSPPPPPPSSISLNSLAALAASNPAPTVPSVLSLQEIQQQLRAKHVQLQNSLTPVALHQQQEPYPNARYSPNFVLLSELEPTTGYGYFLDRGNGKFTRLIPADMLPPMKEIPTTQEASRGMVMLPSLHGPLPPDVPPMNQPVTMVYSVTKPATTHKKPKIYCDKWVHEGVCAFTQQGCRFKHEMPMDKETQFSLGLFHGLPMWWKRQESDAQRLRLAAAGNNTESSSSVSSSPTDVIPSSRSSANISDRRLQTQTSSAHAASQWRSEVPSGFQGGLRYSTSTLAYRPSADLRPAADLPKMARTLASGENSGSDIAGRRGATLTTVTENFHASPLLSPVTLTRAESGHCESGLPSSDLDTPSSSAQPCSAFTLYTPRTNSSNTHNSNLVGGDMHSIKSRSGSSGVNSPCVWGPIAPPKPQSGH